MRRYLKYFMLGLGIFLIWLVSPFIISSINDDWGVRGQIGDSYGALNALFSGLAFAGLIVTILLQREDLKIQGKTLKLQIVEQQKQAAETERMADELESQKNLMLSQRVEGTVFKLIETFLKYRDTLVSNEFKDAPMPVSIGQSLFTEIRRYFIDRSDAVEAFNAQMEMHDYQLKNYFDMVTYILQYINDAPIDDNTKTIFADSFRFNLNEYELLVISHYFKENQHVLLLLNKYVFKTKA